MSIKLETLNATDSLQNIQTAIQQTEAIGYELITMVKGIVGGQNANMLTLHRRTPGESPGQLTLVEVDSQLSLQEQENKVNSEENGGKVLISYGTGFVQGRETMVAAYRG
ncbi:MAG: hypothetical protein GY797_14465 [Deltaproteobacteria bacterium]|nr:hypothetical protein [Deltaproteobacteria bacterium]